MDARFIVKTTMNPKIMRDFQKAHQPEWANTVLWICAVVFSLCTATLWIFSDADRIEYTVYALLFWAFVLLKDRVLGWFAYRGYNKAAGELTYCFTDEGVEGGSALETAQTRYGAYVKLAENSKYYILYVQKRVAVVLPKADFVQGDAAEFGPFIEEKTGLKIKRVRG